MTRALLASVLVACLTACPSTTGTPGPEGPKGDTGEPGATGPAGPAGPQGAQGPEGAAGPQGPEGAQGVQGPPGAVLVVDGGVVSGPPGAAVVVTPIAPGGATCPAGGVRVTQLSDGGISNVCNGADGATGPQGPQGATGAAGQQGAAGPQGADGPQGPQGMTGATGPAGPQGPTGPQGLTGATGSTGPAGAVGPQGPQGPTGPQGAQGSPGAAGATGATGAAGPQGPPGPPGQVLLLDGGTVVPDFISFAGFTVATYNGNLGGHPGANLKCEAEFPGSFFCTSADYYRSEPTVTPPTAGAWVDYDRDAFGNRSSTACYKSGTAEGPWKESTSADYAAFVNASGFVYNGNNCDQLKSLACCRSAVRMVLRGFTTATFNGDLGGHPGANQKCDAQFPGSRFCTSADYYRSNPKQYPPASGAWVDYDRTALGNRSGTPCYKSGTAEGPWRESTSADYAAFVNASGFVYNGNNCDQVKPLACCEAR